MKPETRKEAYLAAIGGQDVDVPAKPITREEAYLAAILNNGLGAKNLEDLADVQIVDPVNGYVVKFDAELGKWVAGPASGSGGTSDYTDLANKPQINGHTLAGDKSAEDLGLAESGDIPTKVSDLDNDVNFISDDDYVHTDNNYDDTAKGIVDGVTEALAGKQDELTFDNIPTENSTNPVKSGGVYSADEAIRKWTTAEAKSVSGNPITLTDGSARNAEGLAVTCNPKQNLHGYDHPWAGGAGKNKLPMVLADIKSANTSGTWSGNSYTLNGVTFTVQTDADENVTGIKVNGTATGGNAGLTLNHFAFLITGSSYVMNGCPTGGDERTYSLLLGGSARIASDYGNGSPTFTMSESAKAVIAIRQGTTMNNAMFYPMIRLASESDATFAPYSNICPITGYTECVVDDHGENFFANLTKDTNKGYIDNYYLTSNGSTAQSGGYYVSEYLEIKPNTAYYIGGILGNSPALCYYDSNKTYISGIQYSNNESITDTSPSNAKYMRLSVLKANESLYMVRYASAIDTATITFGQTVYGGSVDLKTGKVTIDREYLYVDGSDTSILNVATGQLQIAISSDSKTTTDIYHKVGDLLCNRFEEIYSNSSATDGIYYRANGSHNLLVRGNDYTAETTLSDWVTWLGNNPLQIVYGLATPIELTLTPAELELLKGYNYITSNGTTIALAYLPDSLLAEAENYVDAKIPPAPSSDGTYVLTCTVTSGTPAYSWESAT